MNAPTLRITLDLDSVEALNPERDASCRRRASITWARLTATPFLTDPEKRQLAGFAAVKPPDRLSAKFNPHHDHLGRFTTGDGGGDPSLHLIARKPAPPPKPPTPPTPPPPQAATPPPKQPSGSVFGTTPKGLQHTKHSREQAADRGFSDDRIDAIVQHNAGSRVGKIDLQGRKTWEYRDARGNTVVLNEGGGVVTVFSPAPKGIYIEE